MRISPNQPAVPSPPTVASVAARLCAVLSLRDCRYEAFPFERQLPRIERGHIVLPATEPGVEPWCVGAGIELPVRYGNLVLGRFVLVPASDTTGVALSPSARAVALDLADGLAPAIANELLADA